ncbi:hypothetical protein JB92DRAFT_1289243 [Gautieria morchelliformis]|nr:hypothetical protein JB92DRAFT_1289243 [Gautieria morchelliformis]
MWIMSDQLPYGRCKSVRFVFIFGVDVPASGSGRIAALTFASISLAVFTVYTLTPLWVWVGFLCFKMTKTSDERKTRRVLDAYRRGGGWLPAIHDFTRMGVLVSGIFIFGYFVSMTELIISRSHAEFSA